MKSNKFWILSFFFFFKSRKIKGNYDDEKYNLGWFHIYIYTQL